jgi:hypothetical protein
VRPSLRGQVTQVAVKRQPRTANRLTRRGPLLRKERLPDGAHSRLLTRRQRLLEHLVRADNAMPGWLLLVIEFRVHAARDAELSKRYAAAHARTIEAMAASVLPR